MSRKSTAFGLTNAELNIIIEVLKAYPEVDRGLMFGSRALGTNKRGSDIDIALIGKKLDFVVTKISYKLNEESILPFFFDVIDYKDIENQELKEHIDRSGVVFYDRSSKNKM